VNPSFLHRDLRTHGEVLGIDEDGDVLWRDFFTGELHEEDIADFLESAFFMGEECIDRFFASADECFLNGRIAAPIQVRQTPKKRQKKQRGIKKIKSKQWYKRNKARAKLKARKRYKKIKRNPSFKRQQKIRRKHKERFKRKFARLRKLAYRWSRPVYHRRRMNQKTRITQREDRLRYKRDPGRRLDLKKRYKRRKNELKKYHKDYYKKYKSKDKNKKRAPKMARLLATFYREEFHPRDGLPFGEGQPVERSETPGGPSDLSVGNPSPDQGSSAKVLPLDSDVKRTQERWRTYRSAALSLQGLNPDVIEASEGLQVDSRGGDSFEVRSASGKGAYHVKVGVDDTGALKLSCSCPFWRYQGPEHWALKGGYLYGDAPQGLATEPRLRDPDGVNLVCKHVYSVLRLKGRLAHAHVCF